MPAEIVITKEELQEQVDNFGHSEEVARYFGVHKHTILNKAKKFGITWRERQEGINHEFFDDWSRPMAYILGFITGDGCVHSTRPYINTELKDTDICVLEYIRDNIKPSQKIYGYSRKNKKFSWTSKKLCLYSEHIKKSLERYSVFPNKTGKHKLDFYIPDFCFGDYVRGFFDADGSVFYRYNVINSKFTCQSGDFILELQSRLGLGGCIEKTLTGLHCLKFFYKDSLKLRNIMYNNEEFALPRKKERFFNPRIS